MPPSPYQFELGRLPAPKENNLWYRIAPSDIVFVFVHGILSDSRACWLHVDKNKTVYWPDLVKEDQRLPTPSIYLAGYYSALDSGAYEVRDCAREIYDALNREDEHRHAPPTAFKTLVFITHSTGGIVIRYLLERNFTTFRDKYIGLVLLASPSYGSQLADRLAWLVSFYRQAQGIQLQWGSWSLRDLDSRFKDLVAQQKIPGLRGVEASENHFIFHRKWLLDRRVVVTEESAGKYFGSAIALRGTDHFSAAKPDSSRHPSHELLVDFWQNEMLPLLQKSLAAQGRKESGDAILSEYFCYISREKIDQMLQTSKYESVERASEVDTSTIDATETHRRLEMLADSALTFGRADLFQKGAAEKSQYANKLRRLLHIISPQVRDFDWLKSKQTTGLFWLHEEFHVIKIDEAQLVATLECSHETSKLHLHCSLGNFSHVTISDGRPCFQSTNYGFFTDRHRVRFEVVFLLTSGDGTIFYGSPLYLKLPIKENESF